MTNRVPADELLPLRARVPAGVIRALHEEAIARSIPAGRLLAEVLADGLPAAAADRVRRQLAPARRLHVVASDAATPPVGTDGATNALTTSMVASDCTGCGLDDEDASGGPT